jgi:hypothetical protein
MGFKVVQILNNCPSCKAINHGETKDTKIHRVNSVRLYDLYACGYQEMSAMNPGETEGSPWFKNLQPKQD